MENKEKELLRIKLWGHKNPDRRMAMTLRWQAKNKEKRYEINRRHLNQRKRAMPRWANMFFIDEIYALAKLRSRITGIKWEVDHIVPLQGKTACGLHTENNLRVITAKHNQAKYNLLI